VTHTFTGSIAVVPAGRTGKPFPWGGLLVLTAAVFLSVTAETLPTGLLPEISTDLGVDQSQVGLLVSVFAFAVVVTGIPIAHLTRRFSRHRLIVAVLFVVAISSALAAIAPSYEFLVGARILGGIAHGLFWAVMSAYAGYLVPREQLGRAVALTTGGGTLAFVLGVPLGTMLGQAAGWRSAFGAIGILCAIGAVLMVWILPRVERPDRSNQPVHRTASGRRKLDPTVPAIAITCILTAIIMVGHFGFYTFIAPYLTDVLGVQPGNIALLLFLYGVAGAGGLIVSGTVLSRRPTLGLALSIGLSAVTVTIMALANGNAVAGLVGFGLWGLVFGMMPSLLNTRLLDVASLSILDGASAAFSTSFNVGIGSGALFGALLLDALGLTALPIVYIVALLVGLVLLGVSVVLARRAAARE
jgi:DHA1 family inner membrane transport protein